MPIGWKDEVFFLTAIEAAKPDDAPAAKTRHHPRRWGGGCLEMPAMPVPFAILFLGQKTGKPLWQKTARHQTPHEGHHRDHGFAFGSPVTDGEQVFACFGSFGLYCYDMKGHLQWEKDPGDMQTRNSPAPPYGNAPA